MLEFEVLPQRMRLKIRVSPGGCWEWTAAISTSGYGRTYWNGKPRESHRVIYELLVGLIPHGLVIDHICHTEACGKVGRACPHRRCQNPSHMKIVTRGANALRSNAPPAINALKDSCSKGHEYTAETMSMDGGTRRCLICRRDADKRRRPRGVPRKYRKSTGQFHPKPAFPEHRV